MHKSPSAKCSHSNFFLSPNSLKIIFMYTIINNFSTLNFKFLSIETRSYFTPNNITLIYIAKWRDNKFEASMIFQYYQLNFLQSKVKKRALANSSLNHCRNGLPVEKNAPLCRPRRTTLLSSCCELLPSARSSGTAGPVLAAGAQHAAARVLCVQKIYVERAYIRIYTYRTGKGFSHWHSLESTQGSSNLWCGVV